MKKYTISLFGHREISNKEEVRQKLYNYLKERIKGICVRVLVGTHGDFDNIALGVCRRLKSERYNIDITLVFTSYATLNKEFSYAGAEEYYKDVETMIYDIEEAYFKRQIIVSNQKMIDDSDEVVVYYSGTRQFNNNNGTKRVIQYCATKNKVVTNLLI